MHALSSTDPLAWLLVSYLFGSVVCGAWTLGLRILSAALRRTIFAAAAARPPTSLTS